MKTTFGRLFSVTALIMLLAMVVTGLSFRAMAKRYLTREREENLRANANAVSELVSSYASAAVAGQEAAGMRLSMNLTFAARLSSTDTLVCDTDGQVLLCSCREPVCDHIGRTLDRDYVRQVLRSGGDVRETVLNDLYGDRRYVAAQPFALSDGTVVGLVLVSETVREVDQMLGQITEMFVLVALVILLLTVIGISVVTSSQCTPLKNIANAARDFGRGNLKTRVPTGGHNTEEIDELAIAFNNMATSLEKSEYQRQEFVANVSHELKTPMTTIGGYVDGILDGTIPPEKEKKYLTLVSDEIKRLSRLVRSMLDISRLQDQSIPQDQMTRFDVAECLGQALITFEQKINDKGLEVQVDFPEFPVYARGVLDSITQVVYNLIDNAVKFCPQGGELGLRLRSSGEKVYVSVSNTGETIPPEELPLVFERFHKIDKSRSLNRDGWGLGLYIVKTIVCSHGEDISVTSRDGKTEFTFTLTEVNSL
ncbi:MAG: ATP-binding protein [Faecousia sp.]